MNEEQLKNLVVKNHTQIQSLIRDKKVRIKYVRDRKKRPLGCVVQMNDQFGWALCHKSDINTEFSKIEGRAIAITRLLSGQNPEKVPHNIEKMIKYMSKPRKTT